jgi:hypothetical protein
MGRGITRRDLGVAARNTVVGLTVARFAGGSPATTLAAPASQVTNTAGRAYSAYVPVVPKFGQFYTYTCEFDAAWIILATYGIEAPFEELLTIVGHDISIEPWYEQTATGFIIYGGDITTAFSGDFTSNMLARASGAAFQPLFEHFDLSVTPVGTQEELQAALDHGDLVWTKATVDFQPWADTIWITPNGDEVPTVLGNDHAVVINGYSEDVVVISDPLGPTSTNWNRAYEYEIPWATFLPVWGAQNEDALAVSPVAASTSTAPTIDPTVPTIEITGGA